MTVRNKGRFNRADPIKGLIDHTNKTRPLTAIQFAYCVKRRGFTALQYNLDELSAEQLDYCVQRHPRAALKYATRRLNRRQLDFCITSHPNYALVFAPGHMTAAQLIRHSTTQASRIRSLLKRQPGGPLARALHKIARRLDPETAAAVAEALASAV